MNTIVSWLALIIAVIALFLGWVAFDRTGADLEAEIEQRTNRALQQMRLDLDRLEDRTREGAADTLDAGADAARSAADELDEGAANTRTDNE